MKKTIAILFPGIGYTADKPLLYYAGKLAAQKGYDEVIPLKFVFRGGNIRGNLRKMQEALEAVIQQSEETLSEIRWDEYDEILFVSKSIGTIAAAAYAGKHGLSPKHIFYTPLRYTVDHRPKGGIAFIGTKDPWSDTEEIVRRCGENGIPVTVIPEANHSLETGVCADDLRILSDVMQKTENWIRRPL